MKNLLRHHTMKKPFMHIVLIFTLSLILFSACPGWGATYYVKNGGNDSLDGLSDATAWATIQKVQATVRSGDTVYFRSQDTWSSSGSPTVLTATAGVTYDGSSYGSGTRAKFVATAAVSVPYFSVVRIEVSNVTFKGFEIDGGKVYCYGIDIGYNATGDITGNTIDNCVVHDNGDPLDRQWCYGIIVTNRGVNKTTYNTTITNCTVYNAGQEGIAIYPKWGEYNTGVDKVLIRNCRAYDNGTMAAGDGTGVAINNRSNNVTVEYCYLNNNTRDGINIRATPLTESGGNVIAAPTNVVIRYNAISNNWWGGLTITNPNSYKITTDIYYNIFLNNGRINSQNVGYEFHLAGNKAGTYPDSVFNIYNNTFYSSLEPNSSRQWGVGIAPYNSGYVTGATINFNNNIVYTGNFASIWDSKASMTHSNNLIYRASGDSHIHIFTDAVQYKRTGVLTWEASARNSEPLFVSAGTNFSLQPNSPAIDAGVPVGLSRDFVWNPVPSGTAPDIGAFEYQPYPSSSTTTPPSTITGTTTPTTPTTTVSATTSTSKTARGIAKVKKRIFNR